jgi:hypothetical protein
MEQGLRSPRARGDDWRKVWLASLAALTLVKLWPDSARQVKAETFQVFDEALYVRVAAFNSFGRLPRGPYDHLILLKAPSTQRGSPSSTRLAFRSFSHSRRSTRLRASALCVKSGWWGWDGAHS